MKHKIASPKSISKVRSSSYEAILSVLDILPQDQGDIIFLGDSLTAGVDWTKLFGDIRIRNMGIGMDYTVWLLQRLDRITKLKPSKLFIMVGIADLNNLYVNMDTIIENYRTIINTVSESSPETKIYFQSVLPKQGYASSYLSLNDDIIKLNHLLEQLCTEYDFVTFIDLHTLFKTLDNQLNPDYTYDGGHLNGKGYLVWKSAIEAYVKE